MTLVGSWIGWNYMMNNLFHTRATLAHKPERENVWKAWFSGFVIIMHRKTRPLEQPKPTVVFLKRLFFQHYPVICRLPKCLGWWWYSCVWACFMQVCDTWMLIYCLSRLFTFVWNCCWMCQLCQTNSCRAHILYLFLLCVWTKSSTLACVHVSSQFRAI